VDEGNFAIYQFSNRQHEVIPGVRYLCWAQGGPPRLVNYDAFNWMSVPKLLAVPDEEFLPGAKADVLTLLRRVEGEAEG
jgi:hypothetical protein